MLVLLVDIAVSCLEAQWTVATIDSCEASQGSESNEGEIAQRVRFVRNLGAPPTLPFAPSHMSDGHTFSFDR